MGPANVRDAWSELRHNTLRKTGPQVLIGVWFWGLVIGRRAATAGELAPAIVLAGAAAFVFYIIVLRRVLGVLPSRRLPVAVVHFFLLFLGYTVWLAFVPPVQARDLREWLGWTAMATGLLAFLILVTPVANPG